MEMMEVLTGTPMVPLVQPVQPVQRAKELERAARLRLLLTAGKGRRKKKVLCRKPLLETL